MAFDFEPVSLIIQALILLGVVIILAISIYGMRAYNRVKPFVSAAYETFLSFQRNRRIKKRYRSYKRKKEQLNSSEVSAE